MKVLGEFHRDGATIVRRFTGSERKMITNLARGFADTMGAASDPYAEDPVLVRLLPLAVPDDPEASAEFADATRERLAESKVDGANRLVADLGAAGGVVRLDEQGAIVWLKGLGDLRIALAERVGVEEVQRDVRSPQGLVYAWLTWLQGSLVEAVEA